MTKKNTVGYTESQDYRCLEDLDQAGNLMSLNPIKLYYCGMENCEPGWTFGPYVRENYVIHIVSSGKGVFTAGGKSYELSAGNMFLIYPGDVTIYKADEEDPWSYMWIGFKGREAETAISEIGFMRERPVLMLSETKHIRAAIERILDARQLTYADSLKRGAAFMDVLALMIEQSIYKKEARATSEDKYVDYAVELISNLYAEKIRIADIADKVGINRSYLSSLFKRKMHMSPQEFLIDLRLEKAAQLLRDTHDSIGSIAAAVGYPDALAFSKAFRQKYNETPSGYRNSAPELARRDRRGGYTGINKL